MNVKELKEWIERMPDDATVLLHVYEEYWPGKFSYQDRAPNIDLIENMIVFS